MAQSERLWMRWTFAEAGARTVSRLLQKFVGVSSISFAGTFLATAIIGIIQTVGGFFLARRFNQAILTDWAAIAGSVLFGIFAVASTVLGIASFLYGGDVGVTTFILTLAIVPGAVIDWVFFKHPLIARQWLAVIAYAFSGYAILGMPSLNEFLTLPVWVWLSFGNMFTVAINQGLTQAVRKIDPHVKNFWVGLTTVSSCLFALVVLGRIDIVIESSARLWYGSALIGVVVIALVAFNLMSYKAGATIALKKLVMQGSYLILATIFGALFFGEQFNAYKAFGIFGFFLSFALMDEGTWQFFKKRLFVGVVTRQN